jgi:hypothetical protein
VRQCLRRFGTVAIAAAGLVLLAPSVSGSNFGSSNCGPDPVLSNCIANNYTHGVYFANLETAQASATDLSLTYDYNPTDLLAFQETSVGVADAKAFDYAYGMNGWWGWVICPSSSAKGGSNPNVWCKPQELRYNLTYRTVAFSDPLKRAYMACHELGHTVGLRDSGDDDSCMFDDEVTSGVLTSHDVGHIDAKYNPY